jgi:hypothetical protein
VNVGHPRWSATTPISSRSLASRSIVFMKLRPCAPTTHDTRRTVEPGSSSRSPANFDAPYTDWGFTGDHSWYGSGAVPSNT